MSSAKYLITVVTPFHNVDLEMFEKACISVKEQTIGFDNIQWIVVVHNSDKKYLDAVQNLLGNYDNVLIKELNNSAHTPSSPRNYGMQFAEGKYLAFLDGDDSFTPSALETTVTKAKTHGADVVVFRREYELANENLQTVTEITLWNQTFEEIVMDREHWDTEKMFSGVWGMVTSRIFDMDFIRENNIAFDEEIPFAEDMDFVASVCSFADTVVYLPQTIGYHYYINDGSLMQSMDKPGSTLVGYAKGFAKIFEKLLDMGVYADASINGLSMYLAQYIVHSTTITIDERELIRDTLAPYLDVAGKSIVNKTCSIEESEATYSFPREIILNPNSNASNYVLKRKRDGLDVLVRILNNNLDTDYGKRYQFSNIQTAAGYQARVPLTDMDGYRTLSDLQMKIGETGIITSASTPLYLAKILSTGKKRFSLASKEYLDSLGNIFLHQILGKKSAVFYSSRFPTRVYNAYVNDVVGVMLTYYNSIKYSLDKTNTQVVIPDIVLFPQENVNTVYYQVLFAIASPEVELIIASSCWQLCEMVDCLRDNWEMMVNDLEKGTVSGPNIRSKKYEKALNASFTADKNRASYLRKLFQDGFDKNTIKKIWPDLCTIIAPGYDSFRIYKDRIAKYVDDISIEDGFFIIPEGIIGKPVLDTERFELCREDIFYEFLQFDESFSNKHKTILISELEVGNKYIPVITTTSGLYRYKSDIIIQIEKNDFSSVEFSFCGFENEYYKDGESIFDEKSIYEQVKALNNEDAKISDYAFYFENRKLIVLYETINNNGISAKEFSDYLKANASNSYVKNAIVKKIDYGSEILYRELVKYRYQISNDRFSPIRLITTKAQKMFFEGCVLGEGDF